MAKPTIASLFEGYLPQHSFVMTKKNKNLKSGEASESGTSPFALDAVDTGEVLIKAYRTALAAISEKVGPLDVIGDGNPNAELIFVTETETADLGAGGKLLDKMIEAMGAKRSDVYLARVLVKARDEETLKSAELANAFARFDEEFSALDPVNPKVIVALGKTAGKDLLASRAPFDVLRGKVHFYHGHKLIVTFHPDDLLKNLPAKKDCWEDLKIAIRELGWKK
jgi:uracil-DNA glycosylase family 4